MGKNLTIFLLMFGFWLGELARNPFKIVVEDFVEVEACLRKTCRRARIPVERYEVHISQIRRLPLHPVCTNHPALRMA